MPIQVSKPSPADDSVEIHISANIFFQNHGASHEELMAYSRSSVKHSLIDNGMGKFAKAVLQSVDCTALSVSSAAAAIDEESLTHWISTQIEDGHISLESVPSLMARYALAQPAAMRSEFAERMGLHVEPADMTPGKFFVVQVGFDSDNEPGTKHLGTWAGLAIDRNEAQAFAMEAHWDYKLRSSGCRMNVKTSEEPRYLVGNGWGHYFTDGIETITYWVVDRATGQLLDAQRPGLFAAELQQLSQDEAEDLAESLRDNEVLEDEYLADSLGGIEASDAVVDLGCEVASVLPAWATRRLAISVTTSTRSQAPSPTAG